MLAGDVRPHLGRSIAQLFASYLPGK
jgi:hypothetical protein